MQPDKIEVLVKVNGATWTHIVAEGIEPTVNITNEFMDITSGLTTNKEYETVSKHIHIDWRVPND